MLLAGGNCRFLILLWMAPHGSNLLRDTLVWKLITTASIPCSLLLWYVYPQPFFSLTQLRCPPGETTGAAMMT